MSASHRISKQVHARPGQTESQVDPSFQLASICDSVWPGLNTWYIVVSVKWTFATNYKHFPVEDCLSIAYHYRTTGPLDHRNTGQPDPLIREGCNHNQSNEFLAIPVKIGGIYGYLNSQSTSPRRHPVWEKRNLERSLLQAFSALTNWTPGRGYLERNSRRPK